jgi:hypothetical protein
MLLIPTGILFLSVGGGLMGMRGNRYREKEIKVIMERVAGSEEDTNRRVNRAFDILFYEVLRQIENEKLKNYGE